MTAHSFSDKEIKDKVSSEEPYAERVKGFQTGDDLPPAPENSGMNFSKEELIRRQTAAGHTLEDMEMVLAPMVEDAKEAIGSMGDDTPLAVISLKPRQVSHFFRQNFSQVTNPPIDSLRERHVMSLRTTVFQSRQYSRKGQSERKCAGAQQPGA